MDASDLRACIHELEEQNRQLRDALCPPDIAMSLMHLFGLRLHEAKMLALMVNEEVGTVTKIDFALYSERPGDWPDQSTHKVDIYRMRKVLPDWARPQNVWGVGYRLLPGARARIKAMLAEAGPAQEAGADA